MAINTITTGSIPLHTTSPSSMPKRSDPDTTNNLTPRTFKVEINCIQHHTTNMGGWSTLHYGGTKVQIFHQDINALKAAANAVKLNWSMSGGNENIYTTSATTTAAAGGTAVLKGWTDVTGILNQLMGVLGGTQLKNITRNSSIDLTFHNEIVTAYDSITRQCLCNSDCGCNSQCVCNGNCGCHYSDRRLKQDIEYVYSRKLDGIVIPVYEYYYKEETGLSKDKQLGVMAQDLLVLGLSEYVVKTVSGFYGVKYDQLDHIFF